MSKVQSQFSILYSCRDSFEMIFQNSKHEYFWCQKVGRDLVCKLRHPIEKKINIAKNLPSFWVPTLTKNLLLEKIERASKLQYSQNKLY